MAALTGSAGRRLWNGAAQSCLIVNDRKLGDTRGQVALWGTMETEGYFSTLTVK